MNQEQEKMLQDRFTEELEKARLRGMMVGASVVSKIIYEKVNKVNMESTKNDLLKVFKDVMAFCEKGLNADKTYNNAK